jgi:hypothetical protein
MENLRVDSADIVAYSIRVAGDGFAADFHCVQSREARTLYLEPVLQLDESTSNHSRACAQLASALVTLSEQLECPAVHLCIRKGQRGYAAWMRACLYVGFTLTSKAKGRRVVRSGSNMVVLSLACGEEKGFESDTDQSVSTTDDSNCPASPATTSSISGSPWSPVFLDLAA